MEKKKKCLEGVTVQLPAIADAWNQHWYSQKTFFMRTELHHLALRLTHEYLIELDRYSDMMCGQNIGLFLSRIGLARLFLLPSYFCLSG
jgi:hypothetical protein